MKDINQTTIHPSFDTLIMITPKDFLRLRANYARLVQNLPSEHLIFVGCSEVEPLLKECQLGDRVTFLNEDDILPFHKVHKVMCDHLRELLHGEDAPRGATGWYYQQFLKMQYSSLCENTYYMTWDGDTVPCKPFSMFQGNGNLPYMDLKSEHHGNYFSTLEKLIPGMHKCIARSFISEHMLFHCDLMKSMIHAIEQNDTIPGTTYWEKIIHAIEPAHIKDSAFSEFESYGTYVCLTAPTSYMLREWHSFRLAGSFFDPNKINDSDYAWLGNDFDAISFEKNQTVREDNKNLFDNPEYQKKLSARKMLEIAQQEFKGGYIEVWGTASQNIGTDPLLSQNNNIQKVPQIDTTVTSNLSAEDFWITSTKGDQLFQQNPNQAYLCYEHAIFQCKHQEIKVSLQQKLDILKKTQFIRVNKANFIIVTHNQLDSIKLCLQNIEKYCSPESYHITLLDNASTDGTAEWLSHYAENNDQITLLLSDENLNEIASYNIAISYTDSANDILLLNSDVILSKSDLFDLRMALYEKQPYGASTLPNKNTLLIHRNAFDETIGLSEDVNSLSIAIDAFRQQLSSLRYPIVTCQKSTDNF